MRFKGFVGPGYQYASVNADVQRCVNLVPELFEGGQGKDGDVGMLKPTPGLRILANLGPDPIRGLFLSSAGEVFAVSGANLFKIHRDWTTLQIGTILTGSGPVNFADNGTQVMLVDGPHGYIWTPADASLTPITSPNFYGANTVAFMDGYFIINRPDTGEFYLSDLLNGLVWNPLDFATAEAYPDLLNGLTVAHQVLLLFGPASIEGWADTGAESFPFARIPGAVIEHGCSAVQTIQKLDNAVFYLGDGPNGNGILWRLSGFLPVRVSNHAVEAKWRTYGDLSNATAWVYQDSGHHFYAINFPGADTTWVFDVATGAWHERTFTNPMGQQERHRAETHVNAWGTHLVGDYNNGNLYALDLAAATDAGAPITWMRTSPHMSNNLSYMFFSLFQLDLETGIGLDGEGDGTDPMVSLFWSNDAGHTWSPDHWISIGQIGRFLTRAIWRRLGFGRDRVFGVRSSAPVKVTILGAAIDVIAGGKY